MRGEEISLVSPVQHSQVATFNMTRAKADLHAPQKAVFPEFDRALSLF